MSTSSDYKKDIAVTTHGWYMDDSNDFDDISLNRGWKKRAKLIDGSYVITLIGELPLDISSSFKGTTVIRTFTEEKAHSNVQHSLRAATYKLSCRTQVMSSAFMA